MKRKIASPQSVFSEMQHAPWHWTSSCYKPVEYDTPELEAIVNKYFFQPEEKHLEIKNKIISIIACYKVKKHKWTKGFLKESKQKFEEILFNCKKLDENLTEIIKNYDLLDFVIWKLMNMSEENKFPYGSKTYIDGEQFVLIFGDYLRSFTKVIREISDKFPASIPGRESERDLETCLIRNLIHIFYQFYNGEERKTKRLCLHKFVASIFSNYQIATNTHIEEILESKSIPSSSENPFVRTVDKIHSEYKSWLKQSPQK